LRLVLDRSSISSSISISSPGVTWFFLSFPAEADKTSATADDDDGEKKELGRKSRARMVARALLPLKHH